MKTSAIPSATHSNAKTKEISITYFNLLNQLYQTEGLEGLEEYDVDKDFIENILPTILPPQENDSLLLDKNDLDDLYNSNPEKNLNKSRNKRGAGSGNEEVVAEVKNFLNRVLQQYIEYRVLPIDDSVTASLLTALSENRLAIRSFDKNTLQTVLDVETLPAQSANGGIGLAQLVQNAYFKDPVSSPPATPKSPIVGLISKFFPKEPLTNAQTKALSSSSFSILPSKIFRFDGARYGLATPIMLQENMELYKKYTSKEFVDKYPEVEQYVNNIKNTLTRITYFSNSDLYSVLVDAKGKQKVAPINHKDRIDFKKNAIHYQGSEVFDRVLSIEQHNEALVKYRSSSFGTPLFLLPKQDSIHQASIYSSKIETYNKDVRTLIQELKNFSDVMKTAFESTKTDNLLNNASKPSEFIKAKNDLEKFINTLDAKIAEIEKPDFKNLDSEWGKVLPLISEGNKIAHNVNNIRMDTVRNIFGEFGANVRFGYIDQKDRNGLPYQSITIEDNQNKQWSFEFLNGRYVPISFPEAPFMEYYLRQNYGIKEIKVKTEKDKIKVMLGEKVLFEAKSLDELQNKEEFKNFRDTAFFPHTAKMLDYNKEIFFSDYGKDTLVSSSRLYFDALAIVKNDPVAIADFKSHVFSLLTDSRYEEKIMKALLGTVELPPEALSYDHIFYIMSLKEGDLESNSNQNFLDKAKNNKWIDKDLKQKLFPGKYDAKYHAEFLGKIAQTQPDKFIHILRRGDVKSNPLITEEIILKSINNLELSDYTETMYLFLSFEADFKECRFGILRKIRNPLTLFDLALVHPKFTRDNLEKINEICKNTIGAEIKVDENNNLILEDPSKKIYTVAEFKAKLNPCAVGRAKKSTSDALCISSEHENVKKETENFFTENNANENLEKNGMGEGLFLEKGVHGATSAFNHLLLLNQLSKGISRNDAANVGEAIAPIAVNEITGNIAISFVSKEGTLLSKTLRVGAATAITEILNSGMTIYDLYESIRALENSNLTENEKKDLYVNIGVDSGILTISLASTAGMFAGSELAGPIGTVATLLVLGGVNAYNVAKIVASADELVQLDGWDKFKAGLSSFFTGSVSDDLQLKEEVSKKLNEYVNKFLIEHASFINENKCKNTAFTVPYVEWSKIVEGKYRHVNGEWTTDYFTTQSTKTDKSADISNTIFGDPKPIPPLSEGDLKISVTEEVGKKFTLMCNPGFPNSGMKKTKAKNFQDNKATIGVIESSSFDVSYGDKTPNKNNLEHFLAALKTGTQLCQSSFIAESKDPKNTNNCFVADTSNTNRVTVTGDHNNERLIMEINGSQNATSPAYQRIIGPSNATTFITLNGYNSGSIEAPGGGVIDFSNSKNKGDFNLGEENKFQGIYCDGFDFLIGPNNTASTFNSGNSSVKYIQTNGDSVVNIANNSSLEHIRIESGDTVKVNKTENLPMIEIFDDKGIKPVEIQLQQGVKSCHIKISDNVNRDYFFTKTPNSTSLNCEFMEGETPVKISGLNDNTKITFQATNDKCTQFFSPSTKNTQISEKANRGTISIKPKNGTSLEECKKLTQEAKVSNFGTVAFCEFGEGNDETKIITSKASDTTINLSTENCKNFHITVMAENNAIVIQDGGNYNIATDVNERRVTIGYSLLKQDPDIDLETEFVYENEDASDDSNYNVKQTITYPNGTMVANILYENDGKNPKTIYSSFANGAQVEAITFKVKNKEMTRLNAQITQSVLNVPSDLQNIQKGIFNAYVIDSENIIKGKYSKINFKDLNKRHVKVVRDGSSLVIMGFDNLGNPIAYKIKNFDKLIFQKSYNPRYVLSFNANESNPEKSNLYNLRTLTQIYNDPTTPTLNSIIKETFDKSVSFFDAAEYLEYRNIMAIYLNFDNTQKQGIVNLKGFKLAKNPFSLIEPSDKDKTNYQSLKDLKIEVIEEETGNTKYLLVKGYISDIPKNYRDNTVLQFQNKSIHLNLPTSLTSEKQVESFLKEIVNKENKSNHIPINEKTEFLTSTPTSRRPLKRPASKVEGGPPNKLQINNNFIVNPEEEPVASSASRPSGFFPGVGREIVNLILGRNNVLKPVKSDITVEDMEGVVENMEGCEPTVNDNLPPKINTNYPVANPLQCSTHKGEYKGADVEMTVCPNGKGTFEISTPESSLSGEANVDRNTVVLKPKHQQKTYESNNFQLTEEEHFGNRDATNATEPHTCLNANICTQFVERINYQDYIFSIAQQAATSAVGAIFNSKVISGATQIAMYGMYAPLYEAAKIAAQKTATKCGATEELARQIGDAVGMAMPALAIYANPVSGAIGLAQSAIVSKLTNAVVNSVAQTFPAQAMQLTDFGKKVDNAVFSAFETKQLKHESIKPRKSLHNSKQSIS